MTDGKKFYNRLRQTYLIVNNAPGKEELENFWRKILWEKSSTEWRGGLDKKPGPTKSKNGMEPSMCKRRRKSTKNNAKLESYWKGPNTKFLA